MALSAGTLLGPYEIVSLVGSGGMGEVYRARDTRLSRTVAVKTLTAQVVDRPDLKARFEREARTLATLSHPHICSVFDVGRQDGVDYLVMEFLEGHTLAHRLQGNGLPLDEGLKIAIQLADALNKAHRQNIVHRDLKPANIVLTKSGAKISPAINSRSPPTDSVSWFRNPSSRERRHPSRFWSTGVQRAGNSPVASRPPFHLSPPPFAARRLPRLPGL